MQDDEIRKRGLAKPPEKTGNGETYEELIARRRAASEARKRRRTKEEGGGNA